MVTSYKTMLGPEDVPSKIDSCCRNAVFKLRLRIDYPKGIERQNRIGVRRCCLTNHGRYRDIILKLGLPFQWWETTKWDLRTKVLLHLFAVSVEIVCSNWDWNLCISTVTNAGMMSESKGTTLKINNWHGDTALSTWTTDLKSTPLIPPSKTTIVYRYVIFGTCCS